MAEAVGRWRHGLTPFRRRLPRPYLGTRPMTSGVLADGKTAPADAATTDVAGSEGGERPSSPLTVAIQAAIGVALIGLLGVAVLLARQMLILIALAFFLAMGLNPLVVGIQRLGLRRGAAVSVVLLLTFALL